MLHPEKLIPKLIYNIINNKPLPIYGKGENSREWIYVDDHCEALVKILEKGKVGNFYNIGSNINLNNIKISKLLIKVAKSKFKIGKNVNIKFVKDRPGHDFRYAVNLEKIESLGWKANKDFDSQLEETVIWYEENENWWKESFDKILLNRQKRLSLEK